MPVQLVVKLVADWYKVDMRGAINEVNYILNLLYVVQNRRTLLIYGFHFSAIHIIAALYVLQMDITVSITVLIHLVPKFENMNLPKLLLTLIVLVNLNWTWANFHLQLFPASFVSSFFFSKSLFLKNQKF